MIMTYGGRDADLNLSQLNTNEENVLVDLAKAGDREAFEKLLFMYEKFVYNTVRLKLGNAEDAFDVSQEVFIKVWKNIKKYRGDCRFATWVYRISTNACLDFLRHAKATATEQFPTHIDSDGDEIEVEFADEAVIASPERMLEKKEAVNAVREAIARLSPEAREVVELRDINGFSYEEIAEITGLEIGTVKSRLNRARGQLRTLLAEIKF